MGKGQKLAGVKTVQASSTARLDRSGFIPLYYQIQRALIEKILSGKLREGDLLASEEELARTYQVSRMTARQALHGLKASGYAFSQQGRGTFISRPKLEKNVVYLQGFTSFMKRCGLKPSSRMLEHKIIEGGAELAGKLKIQPSDPVLHMRRLRLADGVPISIEVTHLPLKRYPGLERIDFEQRSLYSALEKDYGVRAAWADDSIEAMPAPPTEADLLKIPRGACILSISRTLVTVEEIPIEVSHAHYRGDRYRAAIRVPASPIG